MIILEGPDGSGKSTLAQHLITPCVHTGGSPHSEQNVRERFEIELGNYGGINDRCIIIGELVYGFVLRKNPFIPYATLWEMLYTFADNNWVIVYCRPPTFILHKHLKVLKEVSKAKQHKSPEHVAIVIEKFDKIIQRYDDVMRQVRKMMPFLQYDWTGGNNHV